MLITFLETLRKMFSVLKISEETWDERMFESGQIRGIVRGESKLNQTFTLYKSSFLKDTFIQPKLTECDLKMIKERVCVM